MTELQTQIAEIKERRGRYIAGLDEYYDNDFDDVEFLLAALEESKKETREARRETWDAAIERALSARVVIGKRAEPGYAERTAHNQGIVNAVYAIEAAKDGGSDG